MSQPPKAEALHRERQEQAIARYWPRIDKILEVSGATPRELRATIQRMKLLNREDPKPKPVARQHNILLAAHAAYVRGERTDEVIAGQRMYDRLRKARAYRPKKNRQRVAA